MNIFENFFGFIATITSFIGLFPQIYKTYKTKSAADISLLMLYNYLICTLAWIFYGLSIDSTFVIYSNLIGLFTVIVSITQKRYYE